MPSEEDNSYIAQEYRKRVEELWVAKDSALRTYDDMAQKADAYEELKVRAEWLVDAISSLEFFLINNRVEMRQSNVDSAKLILAKAISEWRKGEK